ncbi:MAG: retention module-containing protein, partial [Burkholderiaceae bacterium]|nr:retention module-containing protein [Burkholderiaceae bacterium]
MATVGVVKAVSGEVTATDPRGNVRVLKAGDRVADNEVIKSANGGNAHIDFNNKGFATLGSGDTLTLSQAMLQDIANAGKESAPVESTRQNAVDVEALQKEVEEALAKGEDPTQMLEAAAAGPGAGGAGGAQEGGNFVLVEQEAARGDLTPGFETGTFGYPVAGIQEDTPLTVEEYIPPPVVVLGPGVEISGNTVHESAIGNDSGVNHLGDGSEAMAIAGGSISVTGAYDSLIVRIDGVEIDLAQAGNLDAPIDTEHGTITFWSNGEGGYEYVYELTTPLDHGEPGSEADLSDVLNVEVVAAGPGGSGSDNSQIIVVDDVPVATADVRDMAESGADQTISGNVMSGETGTEEDSGEADTASADTTGVAWGEVAADSAYSLAETDTEGTYKVVDADGGEVGTLVLGANGAYEFTLKGSYDLTGDASALKVGYTLTDADGDKSSNTLTINLTPDEHVPTVGAGTATVYEAGLNSAADASETGTGS